MTRETMVSTVTLVSGLNALVIFSLGGHIVTDEPGGVVSL